MKVVNSKYTIKSNFIKYFSQDIYCQGGNGLDHLTPVTDFLNVKGSGYPLSRYTLQL